jgi:uncharacterized membrane-anchored protein YhcB (DUF1043 family)
MQPIIVSLLWFAGGAIVGILVASALRGRLGRAAEERAAQLEAELIETRGELEAQGERIEAHFARTSDLFRELTERYTQLYAHLADGARHFCGDELPAIARGLDGLLPAGEREAAESASSGRPERVNGGSPPSA